MGINVYPNDNQVVIIINTNKPFTHTINGNIIRIEEVKPDTITNFAGIGSISSGTLRTEDLIPVFIEELYYHATKNNHKRHLEIVNEIRGKMDNDDYYESEDAEYDLNETLFNALNEYSLPYMYFGSHAGDGSDFGYWIDQDIEMIFDGLKVSDTSEIPDNYNGEVIHINDHGNMTLYNSVNGELSEVWAVV